MSSAPRPLTLAGERRAATCGQAQGGVGAGLGGVQGLGLGSGCGVRRRGEGRRRSRPHPFLCCGWGGCTLHHQPALGRSPHPRARPVGRTDIDA